MLNLLFGLPLPAKLWLGAGFVSSIALEVRDRKDPGWRSVRFFFWPLCTLLGGFTLFLLILAHLSREK